MLPPLVGAGENGIAINEHLRLDTFLCGTDHEGRNLGRKHHVPDLSKKLEVGFIDIKTRKRQLILGKLTNALNIVQIIKIKNFFMFIVF